MKEVNPENKLIFVFCFYSDSSFGIEERYGTFPFAIDEQFRLAIGLTDKEFKFAINGEFFARFGYRTANPLVSLNGFKLGTANGMHIAVTEVNHVVTDTMNCDDIVSMSHPDYDIE